MLRLVTALRVFAVHDLRLVGMQLKAPGPEPLSEIGPQLLGLLLGVAADDHIIRVTLERTAGVFAVHPLVVSTIRRVCTLARIVYCVLSGEDRRMRFREFCSSAAIAEPCPASAGHGRVGRNFVPVLRR